jgi:hypothetical protein
VDSTTEDKFSRHLIFAKAVFEDYNDVKGFVRERW